MKRVASARHPRKGAHNHLEVYALERTHSLKLLIYLKIYFWVFLLKDKRTEEIKKNQNQNQKS